MGHRALVAYERTDANYNVHYSHWGACNLRLKGAITDATPYGSEQPTQWTQELHDGLTAGHEPEAVFEGIDHADDPPTQIKPKPRATNVTLEEAITEHLDFHHYEAFYVVDQACEVTAYRTLWFGLQFETSSVKQSPTVGHGALRTVRWYEGEPVNDGRLRGWFEGAKDVVGDMLDRDAIPSETIAVDYLQHKIRGYGRREAETKIYREL